MTTMLESILKQVDAFPSMPGAASKLLVMLDDPNTTAAQIEGVLRYDPGLTANILKLTNSAYFGIPYKISSVRQAIALLGWKKVFKLVMTSVMRAIADKPVSGYDLPAGELWRHSIAVTVAAEGLARELDLGVMEELFTAALLHDVGKLVLGTFVKDQLPAIEALAAEGMPFEAAEQQVLGTDHAQIGARILKNWSFPDSVVQAVRFHHNPDALTPSLTLVDLVHTANVLCLMTGMGLGREGLQIEPSPQATRRLKLKPKHLEMVASQVLEWISDLSNALGPE